MPILGSDFLHHHHLLVDVAGACLLDAATLEPIPAVPSTKPGKHSELYAALLSTSGEFRDLLAEYPDVISSKNLSASVPKDQVRHSVPTVPGPPVFAKARGLDAEKLESARKEFSAMEAAGVIRRSNSAWASPLNLAQLSPLPVRRNPRREVRDNHRVLHHLHHLAAGGTPVRPWNIVFFPEAL